LYSKNLLQNTKAENLQFACISPSQEEEEGEGEKIMYEFLLFRENIIIVSLFQFFFLNKIKKNERSNIYIYSS
jgi:hypothetical protein